MRYLFILLGGLFFSQLSFAKSQAHWQYLYFNFTPALGLEPALLLDRSVDDEGLASYTYLYRLRYPISSIYKIGLNYTQYHKSGEPVLQRGELESFYHQKFGDFKLMNLSRIEHRYKELGGDRSYRVRHQWIGRYSLPASITLGMSYELMWYSDEVGSNPIGEYTLKQTRWDLIRLGYQFNKHLSVETFYRWKHTGSDLDKRTDYIGAYYRINLK